MPLNYDRHDAGGGDEDFQSPSQRSVVSQTMPPSADAAAQGSRWYAAVSGTSRRTVTSPSSKSTKRPTMSSGAMVFEQSSPPPSTSKAFAQTNLSSWLSSSSAFRTQPQQLSNSSLLKPRPMALEEYTVLHPNTAEGDEAGDAPVPAPFFYGDDSDQHFWPPPGVTTTWTPNGNRSLRVLEDEHNDSIIPSEPVVAPAQGSSTHPPNELSMQLEMATTTKRTWDEAEIHEHGTDSHGNSSWNNINTHIHPPPSKQARTTFRPALDGTQSPTTRWAALPPVWSSVPQHLPIGPPQETGTRTLDLTPAHQESNSLTSPDEPEAAAQTIEAVFMEDDSAPDDAPSEWPETTHRCDEDDCDCILQLFEEHDPFEDVPEIEEALRNAKRQYVETAPINRSRRQPAALISKPSVVASAAALRQAQMPLADTVDSITQLPYMSISDRQLFRRGQGNIPKCIMNVTPGSIVHVNFTPVECNIILSSFDLSPPASLPTVYHKICYVARRCLSRPIRIPKRTQMDIAQFINDCIQDSDELVKERANSYLIYNTSATKINAPLRRNKQHHAAILLSSSLTGSRERRRQLYAQTFESFKPYRVFNIGSCDVIAATFNPVNSYQFAVSCLAYDDGYSRPNNLLLGVLDDDAPTIRALDGHKIRRSSAPATQDFIWSTVSSINYSFEGSQLYSGSYDKTVKIWDASNNSGIRGSLLHNIPVSAEVTDISSHPFQLSLAAGLKDGSITLISSSSDVTAHHIPVPARTSRTPLSVSRVLHHSPSSRHPTWLLAGYEDHLPTDAPEKPTSAGLLTIFDLATQQAVVKFSPNAQRVFDICHGHDGSYFCAAVALTSRQYGKHINSHIRLYDPRMCPSPPSSSSPSGTIPTARPVYEFDSGQKDINKLTCSPCGRFFTSSGTDNATWVFDIRNEDVPLHVLRHGETLDVASGVEHREAVDSGVMMAAWMPGSSDRLLTGGSDGVVKVWDVRRGWDSSEPTPSEPAQHLGQNAFVKDLWCGTTQVMSGCVSPGGEWLVVGETSGRVTALGLGGDTAADGEDVLPFVLEGGGAPLSNQRQQQEEEEESGVRTARELVASGRFVVRDGVAWEV